MLIVTYTIYLLLVVYIYNTTPGGVVVVVTDHHYVRASRACGGSAIRCDRYDNEDSNKHMR